MIELITDAPRESLYFLLAVLSFMLTYRTIGHVILRKYPEAFDIKHAMGLGFAITWHTLFYGCIAFFFITSCS